MIKMPVKQPIDPPISRKQILISLFSVFFGIVAVLLLYLRTQVFNANTTTLNKTVENHSVTLRNDRHSFDIIPNKLKSRTTGVIFYPGALVDSKAYTSQLAGLAEDKGIKVFIVKPYLRLAIINVNVADYVVAANPTIKRWYVGGHSMGGAAACKFSKQNSSMVAGLFLFAAYCSASDKQYPGPTLAFVGSNDSLEPLGRVKNQLPARSRIVTIKGANHASFGDYGSQPLDGKQTTSQAVINETILMQLDRFIKLN